MFTFIDFKNRNIRLTDERLAHIENSHPELRNQISLMKDVLSNPDIVIESKSDNAAELFYKFYENTFVGNKFLCVAVKTINNDSFILTTYFTDTIKKGKILWTKM